MSAETGMTQVLEVVTGSGICIEVDCADCCAALRKVLEIERSLQENSHTSSEPDINNPCGELSE